jgi:hypothetical protein
MSKENEMLPWVIELEDGTRYSFKHVNIHLPCFTFKRENKSPPYVIRVDGKLFISDEIATIERE